MHYETTNESLKRKLKSIRWRVRFGIYSRYFGICGMLRKYSPLTKAEKAVMDELMRQWSESTGSVMFPVPSYNYHGWSDSKSAYLAASCSGDIWNPLQKYGRARRRLLTWLINQL